MLIKSTIAAALISLSTLAAVPAQASDLSVQVGFDGGRGWSDNGHGHHARRQRLSGEEVTWILRDRGYYHISFIDGRGPVFQLRARKNGDRFFLVVNARTGEILSRNRF